MKKTFREKVISKFKGIMKKNRLLKYPCLFVMTIILTIYYICRYFAGNAKKYVCIAFSLVFFMSSCSFSFAVLSGQPGFINAQETYNAIVEDSDVSLAVEKEVTPDESILPDTGDALHEFVDTEDNDGTDFYTLDDILEDTQSYEYENENMDIPEEEIPEEEMEEEQEPVFDSSDWRLVLVNKQHPIPDDYSFSLGVIKDYMRCDKRIIADTIAMLQAAKEDGITLQIQSPYRTADRQENNFNKRIKEYMNQGYSYMDAYKTASQVITVPGASEHQIGLALDITSDTYTKLEKGFGDTEAGKWLVEHSCEYGFILRYPEGKEYITGIIYEPWHFRYVGKEAATVIMQENICLEEFWDKYL